MNSHPWHPRGPRHAVCATPAGQVRRWETVVPPHRGRPCAEDLTLGPGIARPGDTHHPIGDATVIDTRRRGADRQHATIDALLIDRSAAVRDRLRDDRRQRRHRLPPHALIRHRRRIDAHRTAPRGER